MHLAHHLVHQWKLSALDLAYQWKLLALDLAPSWNSVHNSDQLMAWMRAHCSEVWMAWRKEQMIMSAELMDSKTAH